MDQFGKGEMETANEGQFPLLFHKKNLLKSLEVIGSYLSSGATYSRMDYSEWWFSLLFATKTHQQKCLETSNLQCIIPEN